MDAVEREQFETQEYELRARILALQERFGYFFLAASGSAIAFALTQAEDESPGCWMILVLVAIIAWGVSFALSANHLLLKVKSLLGDWKSVRVNLDKDLPEGISEADKEQCLVELHKIMQASDKKSRRLARWALGAFMTGAVLYLLGQVVHVCGDYC